MALYQVVHWNNLENKIKHHCITISPSPWSLTLSTFIFLNEAWRILKFWMYSCSSFVENFTFFIGIEPAKNIFSIGDFYWHVGGYRGKSKNSSIFALGINSFQGESLEYKLWGIKVHISAAVLLHTFTKLYVLTLLQFEILNLPYYGNAVKNFICEYIHSRVDKYLTFHF